jgi:lipopolysaccharide transport system permease protein
MKREIIIKPEGSIFKINFRELWQYRELFYIFSWRDIKLRYKQTVLGVVWVVFQPLVTTGIFSLFFGKIAKIPSDGLPYPLFVLTGLIIWNFFSNGLTNASNSLVANQSMLQKVYFPRIIIPISSIITAGFDFLISLVVLALACIYFGVFPSLTIIFMLPLLLLILFIATVGLGMLAASMNVKYRDIRYALPFFIQISLFLSPVIYPLSAIYDYRKYLIALNPLSGIIVNFRQLFIPGASIDFLLLGVSAAVSVAIFVIGLAYFRKTEYVFADIA